MEATVPWEAFLALIEPVYHKPSRKGGRPPIPLEVMLRIHLLQQWFTLSDPLMEEMLIDTPCFRRFAGIETMEGRIPDETTILNFRHLLEEHRIAGQIDPRGCEPDAEREGSDAVDEVGRRRMNKAKQWFFEMRCPIGIEKRNDFQNCEAEFRIA